MRLTVFMATLSLLFPCLSYVCYLGFHLISTKVWSPKLQTGPGMVAFIIQELSNEGQALFIFF